MIARVWRGCTSPATAEDYQRHYESEVAVHLRHVEGFRGARLLRRTIGDEVAFTSITYWSDMTAVEGFAGADVTQAVVEGAARRALVRWDDVVTHHQVAVDVEPLI